MTATIVDLQIIEREDGVWFEFRFEGGDWHGSKEALKAAVPAEAREWDPEQKVWRVHSDFEPQLSEIFRNFDGAMDGIRSQVSMF